MGITSFGLWVKSRSYNGVVLNDFPSDKRCSSLLLDANGSIYNAIAIALGIPDGSQAKTAEQKKKHLEALILRAEQLKGITRESMYESIFAAFEGEIIKLYNATLPQHTIVIAIDGVPPVAKIQNQKQRRYKSALFSTQVGIEGSSVTPGTNFMAELHNFIIHRFIPRRKNDLPGLIYSSYLDPGEGEHKIMDYFRSGVIPTPEGYYHVVYGLDADLFLLTLMLPINNIYLYRSDYSNSKFSIDALKAGLISELKTATAIQDFALLTYLAGNDFLPHQASMMGNDFLPAEGSTVGLQPSLNTMLQVYIDTNLELTTLETQDVDGGKIVWENFGVYLGNLAQKEPKMLANQFATEALTLYGSELLKQATEEMPQEYSFSYSTFRRLWYNNALASRVGHNVNDPYNKLLDLMPVNVDRIEGMVWSYLTTIAWCLEYYVRGTYSIDFDHYYQYYHAPLLDDIALLVKEVAAKGEMETRIKYATKGTISYTPLHQLIAVLPPNNANLLPLHLPQLQALLNPDGPLGYLLPRTALVEMDHAKEERNGILLLPFAEMGSIDKQIKRIITPEELGKYAVLNPYMYNIKTTNEIRSAKDKRIKEAEGYERLLNRFGVTSKRRPPKQEQRQSQGKTPGYQSMQKGRGHPSATTANITARPTSQQGSTRTIIAAKPPSKPRMMVSRQPGGQPTNKPTVSTAPLM